MRAAVKASIAEQNFHAGSRVEVFFSTNGFSGNGFSGVSYTGALREQAGWLGFTQNAKFMRVINIATGAPAPKIGRIKKVVERSRGGYGYGYSRGW